MYSVFYVAYSEGNPPHLLQLHVHRQGEELNKLFSFVLILYIFLVYVYVCLYYVIS